MRNLGVAFLGSCDSVFHEIEVPVLAVATVTWQGLEEMLQEGLFTWQASWCWLLAGILVLRHMDLSAGLVEQTYDITRQLTSPRKSDGESTRQKPQFPLLPHLANFIPSFPQCSCSFTGWVYSVCDGNMQGRDTKNQESCGAILEANYPFEDEKTGETRRDMTAASTTGTSDPIGFDSHVHRYAMVNTELPT